MATKTTAPSAKILPLEACISLDDLEEVARAKLSPMAAAYYWSAADTHSTYENNKRDWARVGFWPRVLLDVSRVTMQTTIMGAESRLPVFISPAASAGLGHEEGEHCLARGAARMGIPQCVSSVSSVPARDIAATFFGDSERRGGALFFQLYAPRRKEDAVKRIDMAKKAGYQALVVTVDAPVIGKRTIDEKFRLLKRGDRRRLRRGLSAVPDPSELEGESDTQEGSEERGERGDNGAYPLPPLPGDEGTLRTAHTAALTWADLAWIRERWGRDKPLIVKGIQSVEDAVQATLHADVDGIYLSNHGGRQLDYAPSAVQTLLAIRQRHPEVFARTKVYLDGGVMRGSDVVKALCLGATAVGLGRAFLFALSAYGTDGVVRAIEILSDEIQTTLRLLGVTDISQLNESYVNLSAFGSVQARL